MQPQIPVSFLATLIGICSVPLSVGIAVRLFTRFTS